MEAANTATLFVLSPNFVSALISSFHTVINIFHACSKNFASFMLTDKTSGVLMTLSLTIKYANL